MSHASDGEEIVPTPGATGSATISSAMPHSDVDDIYVSVPSPRLNIPLSVGVSNPWLNAAQVAKAAEQGELVHSHELSILRCPPCVSHEKAVFA